MCAGNWVSPTSLSSMKSMQNLVINLEFFHILVHTFLGLLAKISHFIAYIMFTKKKKELFTIDKDALLIES